jgi:hypothetical protein
MHRYQETPSRWYGRHEMYCTRLKGWTISRLEYRDWTSMTVGPSAIELLCTVPNYEDEIVGWPFWLDQMSDKPLWNEELLLIIFSANIRFVGLYACVRNIHGDHRGYETTRTTSRVISILVLCSSVEATLLMVSSSQVANVSEKRSITLKQLSHSFHWHNMAQ